MSQEGREAAVLAAVPKQLCIGGQWVDPVRGNYFENISPVNGKPFTEIARGLEADEHALFGELLAHAF